MTKGEYKKWWGETRKKARQMAQVNFRKYPDCQIVHVPFTRPFYVTTSANREIKECKQIANTLARIHRHFIPYPSETLLDYIEVKRRDNAEV